MRNARILAMGELNVDVVLDGLSRIPRQGEELLARTMCVVPGSSSAIFAMNAAALGARVAFLGTVGDDAFGDFLLRELRGRGVDASAVRRLPRRSTGATVALNFGAERAMATYPGTMDALSEADLTPRLLRRARHLHVSSIFLQRSVCRDAVGIFRRARAAGLTTSLDPQSDPSGRWALSLTRLLPFVDVFLPNERELLAFTRATNVERGLESLRRVANIVAVKLGRRGAIAVSSDGQTARAAPLANRNVVDAIGAGDSFDAGFVVRYLAGGSLADCLRAGNLAGALNTTAAGGTAAFADMKRAKTLVLVGAEGSPRLFHLPGRRERGG